MKTDHKSNQLSVEVCQQLSDALATALVTTLAAYSLEALKPGGKERRLHEQFTATITGKPELAATIRGHEIEAMRYLHRQYEYIAYVGVIESAEQPEIVVMVDRGLAAELKALSARYAAASVLSRCAGVDPSHAISVVVAEQEIKHDKLSLNDFHSKVGAAIQNRVGSHTNSTELIDPIDGTPAIFVYKP